MEGPADWNTIAFVVGALVFSGLVIARLVWVFYKEIAALQQSITASRHLLRNEMHVMVLRLDESIDKKADKTDLAALRDRIDRTLNGKAR